MSEPQQIPTIRQALDLALRHHKAGRLAQAESIYQRILLTDPNQASALNLLGMVAHQVGKNDKAVDLINRALAIEPDYADAHNNLGNVLLELGRPEDAVTSYSKALEIKPDLAEANNNLGNAFQKLNKQEDAVASYRKALEIKPDYAKVHYNLGNALKNLGKLKDAAASYQGALAIDPDYVEAHNNLGNVLQDLGKPEAAVANYRKALAIKPDLAEAHNNLGNALKELGKPGEALAQYRRAIFLDPKNDLFWVSFAGSLEQIAFTSVDDTLYQDLLHLLERPTVRPSYITRSIISAIRHHPAFPSMVEATNSDQQDSGIPYSDIAEQLSTIPLFLRIMELSPVYDLEIERMLTVLRRAMLAEAMKGKTDKKIFPLSTALALHCFTNEYVLPETVEEKEAIEHLQEKISTLVENRLPFPPSYVVALGAYRPLFQFSWAEELSEWKWEDAIKNVIQRQITEPLKERSLRDQISCITPIQNAISQSVRAQYEENPYPRWIKTDMGYKNKSLSAVLTGSPLFFDLGDYTSPESPDILMAGCGTGQHTLVLASRFMNAQVLAVDLSLNSLTYAERKTRELGFSNIEYVQGDILELGQLERQFDLIGCTGVLHHLSDPLAGWQVLVDLLRPGGLMKVGLYSEVARQDIIAGRSLISEKGYSTSTEDIRRCRQDIIAMAANGNTQMAKICNLNDFFSTSDCRDLLFHVQEQQLTVPQIEAALTSLQLKFLGFEMRNRIVERKFKESHANKSALTSLSLWHKFELDNPDTFIGMYQFWCKKL